MENPMPSEIDILKDEIKRLKDEMFRIKTAPQIPESAIRAVWEHGAACSRGSLWDEYGHRVGQIFVDELKAN